MRLGMSYTEAMSLTPRERMAWGVALGMQHGGEYDFGRNRWTKAPQVL